MRSNSSSCMGQVENLRLRMMTRTHTHHFLSCSPKNTLEMKDLFTSIFISFWVGFLSKTSQSHSTGNGKLVSPQTSVAASPLASLGSRTTHVCESRSPPPPLNTTQLRVEQKRNPSHVENSAINKQLCRPFRWGPTAELALRQQSNSL